MKKIYNLIRKITKFFGILVIRDRPSNSPDKQLSTLLSILNINLIFDVGANEGQFAKGVRQEKYKSKIVSFEPISLARRKLINLASKDKNWIIHEQCALGDSNGEIKINISKNLVSSSILPINPLHTNAEKESIYVDQEVVPICKIDDIEKNYINSNSRLFIKIDTQGYEKQILHGSKETLKKAKGVLCELSLAPLYDGQVLWREIVDILDKQGFIIWALQKGFTNPNTGQTLQMDGIFIKKNEMNKILKKIDEKYYK